MHRRRLLLVPAGLLLLAGCSSQDPAYYTLEARPPVAGPVGAGPRLVELRRIGLAGYLDRPEIVRNNGDYRMSIPSGERWGEPLGDMVARILAEDLNQRLPGSSVFTSSGTISATADATVELDLQRFDSNADGTVLLLAQVAVLRGRARDAAQTQTIRLSVPPSGPGTRNTVAALSTALGQLSDRVAAMLRSR